MTSAKFRNLLASQANQTPRGTRGAVTVTITQQELIIPTNGSRVARRKCVDKNTLQPIVMIVEHMHGAWEATITMTIILLAHRR